MPARDAIMSEKEPEILLVEDDATLQRNLKRGLVDLGYKVRAASNLEAARRAIEELPCDLLLLDLGLPDGSGFDFLKTFRALHAHAPVLILTARDQVADKIKGLDLGADDYLVKPFDFQELSARIRAQLRRAAGQLGSSIRVRDLEIDLVKRLVTRAARSIELTPREFDVLVYLARSPGQVISRAMLTQDVWRIKSRLTSMDNVIDVLISRLREKIDGDFEPKLITTVRGLGYQLKDPQ